MKLKMKRRKLSPEKKVEILREHLHNKISISELSERYSIIRNKAVYLALGVNLEGKKRDIGDVD